MSITAQALQELDELLGLVDHCLPGGEAEYAHEHVWEARTYLLGAMPGEFRYSLELTEETLARMEDSEDRRHAQEIVASLLRDAEHPSARG